MRGYSLGAEAGIENVMGNGSGKLGDHRQRTGAMHATQHFAGREMQGTQVGLAIRRVAVVIAVVIGIVRVAVIVRIVNIHRAAGGMPCGMR